MAEKKRKRKEVDKRGVEETENECVINEKKEKEIEKKVKKRKWEREENKKYLVE